MADPTLTLAIETSNPSSAQPGWTAVAVGRVREGGAQVLAFGSLEPIDRHDDALLPAVDRVCRGAAIDPSELGRVAVSVGPGGFTALRIAATAAKMLALTHGCRCIAVPTAGALVRRAEPPVGAGDIAVALGWKRDSVWLERFVASGDRRSAALERTASLDLSGVSTLVCDDRFAAMLRELDRLPRDIAIREPRFDAIAVLEASAAIKPTPALEFGPLYPREPEAVTKWRELHG
jgi:tRNA threonylcarbamoyl adenosine modification protein YeaZ